MFVKRPRPGLALLTHGKHVQWESQLRDPMEEDDIGVALTEGLYNAIAKELKRQQRPINLPITANGFTHAYQWVVSSRYNPGSRLYQQK